jgi:serine/threonine protein phosphatase PrpC
MEDTLICDREHGIYVVADGITRQDVTEYELIEDNKISYNISQKFCQTFAEVMVCEMLGTVEKELVSEKMRRSFSKANLAVKDLVDDYVYEHPSAKTEIPGTVAICAMVYNDALYYGSVGDCIGILVRNGKKIIFSDKQTTYAYKRAKVERDRVTLVNEYVNNPTNPFGYGVINGDTNALKYFKVSHLSLEYGDEIYLLTDGIADYIRYCDHEEYSKLTVDEILKSAVKMEENLLGENCSYDDMALIRIKWTSNPKGLIIEN